MEYLLGLAGVIIGIIAWVKASRAQNMLREPWTGLDATAERLQRLGRRLKSLEDFLRRKGVLPSAPEPKPPEAPKAAAPTEEKPPVPAEEVAAPPAAPGKGPGVAPPPVPRPVPATPPPPPPPTPPLTERIGIPWEKFEEVVGKQWLTWVGVLVLFVAAGLFLKHAFDKEWIGPGTQILLACLAGVVLVVLGFHFLRKEMRALGQGFIGGGLMILYVALFCAYSPDVYDEPVIQSQKLTFALMCVVTLIGIVTAVRCDALPISFLAVLGGFLTPVLVSTGVDARDTLFAYLLLLDLSVLAVAFYKRWRALDVLSFLGTTLLFGMWYHRFYAPAALVPAMLWLSTFYVVFLVLPFVHHLRAKTPITVERFVMALANATFAFGYAWRMMGAEHSEALAGVTLVMAGFYLALSILTRMRIPDDRRSLLGFTALAVTCLTITMPLYFKMNGITLGWTAQACVLLYLGYRFAYRPVRIGGALVLLLMVMRVFWTHWDASASRTDVFTLILNGEFLILMCAPIGAAVFAVVHHVFRKDATTPDRTMKTVCTIGAGLLLLVFLHTEIAEWLRLRAEAGVDLDTVRASTLTILWAVGAVAFLTGGRRGKSLPVVFAGLVPLAVALVHAVALYFLAPRGYLLILNRRFSACLIFTGVLTAYAFMPKVRELKRAALIAVGYLSLILLHVEIWRWIQQALPPSASAGYAVRWAAALVWALGAAAFLVIARRRDSRPTMCAGLAPLAIAVLLAVALYFLRTGENFAFIGNARCLVCIVVAAVLWAYAFLFHDEPRARNISLIFAGYGTVLLAHVEIWRWLQVVASGGIFNQCAYITRGVLPILWSLGVVGYLAAARQWRVREAYWGALVPLGVAFICGILLYAVKMPADYAVVLNARFLGGLVVCTAVFMTALALRRDPELAGMSERSVMAFLSWVGLLLLLVVLSIEPCAWVKKTITDRERAAWLSQMSLTIVWGVYASGMLSVGFYKLWRPLRLAALGLFGVTVLKLAFVDLAGLEQIYRILSFFVLGVLILGAAYLYHKAETLLTQTGGPTGEDADD